jgi:fatty acid desaturase
MKVLVRISVAALAITTGATLFCSLLFALFCLLFALFSFVLEYLGAIQAVMAITFVTLFTIFALIHWSEQNNSPFR